MTKDGWRFVLKVIKRARHDPNFRKMALQEFRHELLEKLPARLVTPRRDYVFCRDLAAPRLHPPKGRWLPPGSLKYRLAAYGLLLDDAGHLLLVSDRTLSFRWNLPGGGVHKSETLPEGLQREFLEETSLEVAVGDHLTVIEDFVIMPTGQAVHALMHFYFVTQTGGTMNPNGNGFDTSQVAYVDLATLQPHEAHDYELLTKLVEKIHAYSARTILPER